MISIIIPTRNRFKYVTKLIQDVINQNNDLDFELIVVDQSDNPQNLEHCKHIITDTSGPCVSRNIGVKESIGEILVFLDDDARIGNNFIKEITQPILNGKYPVVAGAICDPEGNYHSTKEDYLTRSSNNFIKILTSNPNHEESRITLAIPGGCMAILKSCFEKVGGFDEELDPSGAGEDRDMAIRLYKEGFPIWYNAKAKLLHEKKAEGGSADVGNRNLMVDVHTYKMCKKYFSPELAAPLKHTILKTYRQRLFRAILRFNSIRYKFGLYMKVKKLMS